MRAETLPTAQVRESPACIAFRTIEKRWAEIDKRVPDCQRRAAVYKAWRAEVEARAPGSNAINYWARWPRSLASCW
jgi:hypothetical protein